MNHSALHLLPSLTDKYRRLLALRSERQAQPPVAELRALARQYPGSLRELDQLPLAAIRERLDALELLAASGGEPARWMLLQLSYHGVMRATLRIKRWARHWPSERALAGGQLAARYVPGPDEPALEFFDAELLSAIRKPPDGRLNPLVLQLVARVHGVEPDEVRQALFPR